MAIQATHPKNSSVDQKLDLTDEEAWQSVLSKDPLMDGRFVYAVRTTGVFCRPVCSSRRPNRRNVTFFATPEQAEAAGYRSCQRCHPTGVAPQPHQNLLEGLFDFIESNLDTAITLDTLAEHAGLSPWHLQRTFKKLTGMTPREYVKMKRTERMKVGLRTGDSVSRAIYDAGFNSSSVVYESASQTLGMTPAAYRSGGAGIDIQYMVADCRLGKLLVAATDRGICSIALGDSDEELAQHLGEEFPNASLERSFGGFEDWLHQIIAFVDGDTQSLDLPLNVGGTNFQQRVWQELRAIPYGATRTYTELAEAIDAPAAVRAVANACANNRAALAIPCHRIVRADGSMGGYKWGLKRKEALLATEKKESGS